MGHKNSVFILLFWEGTLLSGSGDAKIIRWNENTGQIIHLYEGHMAVVQIISIFENYLYSAGQELNIFKWNIDSGTIDKTFLAYHRHEVWCLAFEAGYLYSGSLDKSVIRRDLNTFSRLFTYSGRRISLQILVLWKNVLIAAGDSSTFRMLEKSQNLMFPVEVMSDHSSDVYCLIVFDDTLFSGSSD